MNNSYIINNSNCINYPPNNFKLGKLLVQRSTYGIRQIFFNDDSNTIYTRNRYADINNWSNWEQIYPDYSSISLQTNGYIIFNNDLILQWTSCGVSFATASEGAQVYIAQYIPPLSNVKGYASSLDVIDSGQVLIASAYNDMGKKRYIRVLAATDVIGSYMEYSYFMFGVIVH